MSTLEERREARRRRRQQEDEPVGTMTKTEISELVDARLQERRLERQRRRQEAAASINGGEDDLERRRRERREARLRGGEAPAEEETTSRRSRRNRGGDDETPAEETTSVRSRRRRGGDDEEAPAPEPEPPKPAEEPASTPAAEEDDSAAREAEAAERRRREEEEEEERRRQQEELRRRQEEERRRQEEERRRREEEERKRRSLKRSGDAEHASRSVRISAKSPRHSAASSADVGGDSQACGSARSTHSGLPNTGRSLSDCYFNYASDDAISEIAMENERLMEEYDLGSSFDDMISEPEDSSRRHRSVSESPHAPKMYPCSSAFLPGQTKTPDSAGRHDPGTKDNTLVPPDVDIYSASSDSEEQSDDDSVPFSREHQGSVVEGHKAGKAIRAYNSDRQTERATSPPEGGTLQDNPDGGSVSEGGGSDGERGKSVNLQGGTGQRRELPLTVENAPTGFASKVADVDKNLSEDIKETSDSKPSWVGSRGSGNVRPSAVRHKDIASRMNELQRQLQGDKNSGPATFGMRKMHSQGDLSSAGVRGASTSSKINDILGQLSNRLKKRDAPRSPGGHDEINPPLSPLYRSQSEPLVADMARDKLKESPVAPSQRNRADDSVVEKEEEEQSFMDTTDSEALSSDRSQGDGRAVLSQHASRDPPLHAAPTTPAATRTPGTQSRGGRPDKIKEELRLCLDFLDDPAEDLDSEEEEAVHADKNFRPDVGVADEAYDPYSSSDSSCSEISPRHDFCETDENFAEDEASYVHGESMTNLNTSGECFSQPQTPSEGWRDRACSEPFIRTQERIQTPRELAASAVDLTSSVSSKQPETSTPAIIEQNDSSLQPQTESLKTTLPVIRPNQQSEETDQRQKLMKEILARTPRIEDGVESSNNSVIDQACRQKEQTVVDRQIPVTVSERTPKAFVETQNPVTGDLHSLLCAEIAHAGGKRPFGQHTDSVDNQTTNPSEEFMSQDSLIRPSDLKSNRSEGFNSARIQHEKQRSQRFLGQAIDSALGKASRPEDAEFERKNLMSFWEKKAEENVKLGHQFHKKVLSDSPKSWKNGLASTNGNPDVTVSPEVADSQLKVTAKRINDSGNARTHLLSHVPARTENHSRRGSVDSIDSVFTPGATTPDITERKQYLPRSIPPEPTATVPGAQTSAVDVSVQKSSPPSFLSEKSSSMSQLQLPRAFLADKPPSTSWTPPQKASSSSSVDEPQAASPLHPQHQTNQISLRVVERRGSNSGPPVMPRKVSLSDIQRTLQKPAQPYDRAEQNSLVSENRSNVSRNRSLFGVSDPSSPLRLEESDKCSMEGSVTLPETENGDGDVAYARERASQKPSESDKLQKRVAPRPKFNARRLTQENNIPAVWKCSDDAKTEYKPSPLPVSQSTDFLSVTSSRTPPSSVGGALESHPLQENKEPDNKYKSWAADFLRDRILRSEDETKLSARGTPSQDPGMSPVSPGPVYPWAREDRRFSQHSVPIIPDPVQPPPPVKHKPMSITERINMLSKSQSQTPQTPTSSVSDFKPGSIADREGPEDTPRVKSHRDGPTVEQKKFASLLQNRLINIIAEEEREKERTTRKPPAQRKKMTPAQEIARSRAMSSRRNASETESPLWSPSTTKPVRMQRAATDSQLLKRQEGSVRDIAKEFDNLTDSFSKDEGRDTPTAVTKRRGRRLSTGFSVKEMAGLFENPDSLPSSRNSTRPNSPKVVSSIPDRVIEKFETPSIPESRPVVNKDMVMLSHTGHRKSVADIVNRVETVGMDGPRSPSDSSRHYSEAPTRKTSVSLVRVGAVITDDAGAPVVKLKKDRSRRYTTGINFAELQLRFTQPNVEPKKSNQSRAMSTIYASCQDLTKRSSSFKSAHSMENLTQDTPMSIFRQAKSRLEASADNSLDVTLDSLFDGAKSRSDSFAGNLDIPHDDPPDIQSPSGSAFSRLSSAHSPIKVAEATFPLPGTSSLNKSPEHDAAAKRDSLSGAADGRSFSHSSSTHSLRNYGRSAEEEERAEQERMEREREEEERRREEEEKKKKKGKRKGLGGLSPEKKKLLKKLIMQKAAEDLRNEAKAKALEKEKYINERVPALKTEGMGQAELQRLVKELHAKVAGLEEEVYDWEIKIRKQDFEINELTLKVNDTKGKFIKPVLRKVNKTESKLTKLQTKESRDFRGNLKSTGQNKFALKEDDDAGKTPDWREALKHGHEGGEQEGEEAAAES